MELKPLQDNVIINEDKEEEKSVSGIILPTSAAEKPTTGKIVAVGPGRVGANGEIVPPAVSPGDKVIFSKYAITSFTVGEDEISILSEPDILAIIK